MRRLPKSIIFDFRKVSSNWIFSNDQDIDICYAYPVAPSQRALNDNLNGLLRIKVCKINGFSFRYTSPYFKSFFGKKLYSKKTIKLPNTSGMFIEHVGNDIVSRLI